jgi:D-beta-D-heptose 7-phosphate kinase/D-beta-D-heptose 1-phosphate adenosyltransferase
VVLGDLMMDEYLWGRATRISPECPVMVVNVESETSVPGGAANVVNNLLALGAQVAVIGVVGADATGATLVESLRERGADTTGIVTDSSRATTRKTRVVAHSQQVLRVDREQTDNIDETIADRLLDQLDRMLETAECVTISDYSKGVLTPRVADATVRQTRKAGRLLTANPKPKNVATLAGAHLIQLNQSEAELAARDERFSREDDLEAAGAALVHSLNVDTLIVTRGARGLNIWCESGDAFHVPVHPVEVYDVAGAGDTVISAVTLGLLSGATVHEAAIIANHAASCVVRKVGVATVTQNELQADWQEIAFQGV